MKYALDAWLAAEARASCFCGSVFALRHWPAAACPLAISAGGGFGPCSHPPSEYANGPRHAPFDPLHGAWPPVVTETSSITGPHTPSFKLLNSSRVVEAEAVTGTSSLTHPMLDREWPLVSNDRVETAAPPQSTSTCMI